MKLLILLDCRRTSPGRGRKDPIGVVPGNAVIASLVEWLPFNPTTPNASNAHTDTVRKRAKVKLPPLSSLLTSHVMNTPDQSPRGQR